MSKTTVLGIAAAVFAGMLTPQAIALEPAWLHTIAAWALTVGLAALGYHAEDASK